MSSVSLLTISNPDLTAASFSDHNKATEVQSTWILVAIVVGATIGSLLLVLGGMQLLGKIGTVGFMASLTAGTACLFLSLVGLIRFVVLSCNKQSMHSSYNHSEALAVSNHETSVLQSNEEVSSSSFSIDETVKTSHTSSDEITLGQGEYIVFHKSDKKQVTRETFEKVYSIFNQYSPRAITDSKVRGNRYAIIKSKVKEIDDSLEIAFIPRTLYELFLVRKCIKEDLKAGHECFYVQPDFHRYQSKEEYAQFLESSKRKKHKCWHLCLFSDAGDNEHVGVKEIAYRLNHTLVKTLNPSGKGFSLKELSQFTESEITFLKDYHDTGKAHKIVGNCSQPGPAYNFGIESMKGEMKPMGIRREIDAQIIRNAVELECSPAARQKLFLYRGADLSQDDVVLGSTPYSLSFGTGLFAGCVFDGGATAYCHMRGKNAYAIPVPYDQANDSLFYIPNTNAIAQFYGKGETFHGRTKARKGYDIKQIKGVHNIDRVNVEHLKSELSEAEICRLFKKYKKKAVHLK